MVVTPLSWSVLTDKENVKKKEAWPLVNRLCDTHFDVLWLNSHINIRISENRL
jgi:hypothetical protein